VIALKGVQQACESLDAVPSGKLSLITVVPFYTRAHISEQTTLLFGAALSGSRDKLSLRLRLRSRRGAGGRVPLSLVLLARGWTPGGHGRCRALEPSRRRGLGGAGGLRLSLLCAGGCRRCPLRPRRATDRLDHGIGPLLHAC
jgi:hypothetical protein